jgi:hypothetical protein
MLPNGAADAKLRWCLGRHARRRRAGPRASKCIFSIAASIPAISEAAQRLQASQVFAIPCVEGDSNLSTALTASGLQLARPLFRIKFPGIIVRFAESHGNLYVCVVFIVALVSLGWYQVEPSGTASLVLNSVVIYGLLGFFSCKCHNIDSVAAERVSTSFRFVCICFFFLFIVALSVRATCITKKPPKCGHFHGNDVGFYFVFVYRLPPQFADNSPNGNIGAGWYSSILMTTADAHAPGSLVCFLWVGCSL